MLAKLKQYLRGKLLACPPCHQRYLRLKYEITRVRALTYCLLDIWHSAIYMHWPQHKALRPKQIQAKLLFYYHKIEKGLSMPGAKRLFALEVIPQVTSLLEAWEQGELDRGDPIYLGAIHSLHAYVAMLEQRGLDPTGKVLPEVRDFLSKRPNLRSEIDTPFRPQLVLAEQPVQFLAFETLVHQRRSYRHFSEQRVDPSAVRAAVSLAQWSPSACNRQPCRVYVVESEDLKRKALSHQNGNAGFGHLAPLVLAITADASYFFDATERHQPFVDGGLFTMSLIYALQVQGLVSCCLNWCVQPAQDRALRKLLPIQASERVVMLMVVGHPHPATVLPRSHRKSLDDILSWH